MGRKRASGGLTDGHIMKDGLTYRWRDRWRDRQVERQSKLDRPGIHTSSTLDFHTSATRTTTGREARIPV